MQFFGAGLYHFGGDTAEAGAEEASLHGDEEEEAQSHVFDFDEDDEDAHPLDEEEEHRNGDEPPQKKQICST